MASDIIPPLQGPGELEPLLTKDDRCAQVARLDVPMKALRDSGGLARLPITVRPTDLYRLLRPLWAGRHGRYRPACDTSPRTMSGPAWPHLPQDCRPIGGGASG